MKKFFISLMCLACSGMAMAGNGVGELFVTDSCNAGIPYRIPAIAKTATGRLIALTDCRWNGSDIGCSQKNGGRIDIVGRISDDNGKTWKSPFTLAQGRGDDSQEAGYGDAAIVADRDGQGILVLTCMGSGTDSFWSGRQTSAVFRSTDNGDSWKRVRILTAEEKKALLPNVYGWFFSSGRICQSKMVKKGKYYRVYSAVDCCLEGYNLGGNYVLYSDDFGDSWQVLGSNETPCVAGGKNGDECKVEEMPDGSVIISSRDKAQTGRIFNRFTFTDKSYKNGSWAEQVRSNAENHGTACKDNDTNGEILLTKAKRTKDGKMVNIVLQSLPLGPGRTNVGIYYKELNNASDYEPVNFAKDWSGPYRVSDKGSAYSTMTIMADGNIGFYYEETTHGADYTEVFKPLSIETITSGEYR